MLHTITRYACSGPSICPGGKTWRGFPGWEDPAFSNGRMIPVPLKRLFTDL